jgi:hypothetical protein
MQNLEPHQLLKYSFSAHFSGESMINPKSITSSNEWITALAAQSTTVMKISKKNDLEDVSYVDASGENITAVDAYNFANDHNHTAAFSRSFNSLNAMGASDASLKKLVTDLTLGRNTGGAVSELLAYLWLVDHQIPFQIQVSSNNVLNPNGSELDGKITVLSDVFFDIKTFGFQEVLAERLRRRLEKDISGTWIAIEGSWDVSVELLGDLLAQDYQGLLSTLKKELTAQRGKLLFVKRNKTAVQISHHTANPYMFAEENAAYAFRYANKFCRSDPFILLFTYHPWLGATSLNTNFVGSAETFTRALARRTFIQFLNDCSTVLGVTKAEASTLISAIAFLNISYISDDVGKLPSQVLWLYLNPNAKNPVHSLVVDHMRLAKPYDIAVDDFAHDNY